MTHALSNQDFRPMAPLDLAEHLRTAIAEIDDYYTLMIEAGENPNLDHIGYLCETRLDDFRALLRQPTLTQQELEKLLRGARIDVRHMMGPRPYVRIPKPIQAPDPAHDWARMMARCVMKRVNQNNQE